MNTEIELKFLVLEKENEVSTVEKISELLDAKKYVYVNQTKTLTNSYFDTADLALRHQDKGLRIRTSADENNNKQSEQTIKTTGKVVGGLHQRPEYNVDITGSFPELSLFPQDIWPENQSLDELQNQLISLFSTNFSRVTWLITIEHLNNEESVVELVFDQGVIQSKDKEDVICEIELELVKGHVDDLLALAKVLCFGLQLRPGIKSKAARGYALYHQHTTGESTCDVRDEELSGLSLIPLKQPNNIEQVFSTGVEYSLTQLQTFVDAYSAKPSLAILNKITETLALLRQGFWLFDQCLNPEMKKLRNELSFFIKKLQWVEDACHLKELTTKTGNYRTKLHYSDALIEQLKSEKNSYPDSEQNIALFHSARFNRVQLSLLSLLLSKTPLVNVERLSHSDVISFAQTALEFNRQNLVKAMSTTSNIDSAQYINHHKLLIRSLLTGSWFGSLYEKSERLAFRNPWLDIKIGISELQTILLLQQQLRKLAEADAKLTKWLDSKIEHLLLTLEQSRVQAVASLPYWDC